MDASDSVQGSQVLFAPLSAAARVTPDDVCGVQVQRTWGKAYGILNGWTGGRAKWVAIALAIVIMYFWIRIAMV